MLDVNYEIKTIDNAHRVPQEYTVLLIDEVYDIITKKRTYFFDESGGQAPLIAQLKSKMTTNTIFFAAHYSDDFFKLCKEVFGEIDFITEKKLCLQGPMAATRLLVDGELR